MTTKKNQKGNKEGEKTYQIRPVFTKKFRPQVSSTYRQFLTFNFLLFQEAKDKIEVIVKTKLMGKPFNQQESTGWCKDIADETKAELKNLDKDKRYKFLVQCVVGQNIGQGVRVGSRQFWDEDTDDVTWVSYVNDSLFCMVSAFAVYLY